MKRWLSLILVLVILASAACPAFAAYASVEKIKVYSPSGEKTVEVGKTLRLAAEITPAEAQENAVSWKSSDAGIASVDKNGRVKGISEGRAKITATASNGKSSSLTVTVTGMQASELFGADAREMMITIDAYCDDTNGVGDDWYAYYEINGYEVQSGDTITLCPGDELIVYTEMIEDEQFPDIGSRETSHIVTESNLQKGFRMNQTVTVTEDRGVYKDYSCIWKVTYSFK